MAFTIAIALLVFGAGLMAFMVLVAGVRGLPVPVTQRTPSRPQSP